MSTETEYVYEVVDATDDERYFPLALFTDFEKAIEFASTGDCPSDYAEEYASIEVSRRSLNRYCDGGFRVATVLWEERVDDDDSRWVVNEVKRYDHRD